MNKKLLALYGLKWSPFSADVPVEALLGTPCMVVVLLACRATRRRKVASLSWPARPAWARPSPLRALAARLAGVSDVQVGPRRRPQARPADFYRELGELLGVELHPHNRCGGAKVLRERWQSHIDASISRPVLVVDEAGDDFACAQ